ncbi:MAG: hypothetical protein EB019_06035, partial [Actinobacteria bacterium]|nr:hypothetical protein [Actinomycetota bacterium]
MNIQELQTILHYKFPIKLFVWNNDGYLSIRASQKNYFEERYIGEGPRSGVTIPDTLRICDAYGIPARRVRDFQSGSEWINHEVSGRVFQSIICFEVLDDDFIREGLSRAEFVVAQTNNATFGRSPQARQQLQIVRARAAEFQRDFAVVSTTGFTAHVNSKGEMVESLEQFVPGSLEMILETREERALASRIGSWAWIGIFLVTLAVNRRSVFSR